ncbi:MAG: transposase [Gammaproteobacteria bacterium]|nr:transposase [Gammaproteobacteria bacterium]
MNFPCAAQVLRVERERTELNTAKTQLDIVYGIIALAPQQANPERLLRLNRRHWSIENRSHSVRDVTFDEDRSQVRTRNGPTVMATLRNFAISLLRLLGVTSIANQLRT